MACAVLGHAEWDESGRQGRVECRVRQMPAPLREHKWVSMTGFQNYQDQEPPFHRFAVNFAITIEYGASHKLLSHFQQTLRLCQTWQRLAFVPSKGWCQRKALSTEHILNYAECSLKKLCNKAAASILALTCLSGLNFPLNKVWRGLYHFRTLRQSRYGSTWTGKILSIDILSMQCMWYNNWDVEK